MKKEEFVSRILEEQKSNTMKVLGCQPTYEVYKTKNYGIFRESFDNRIDFTSEPKTPKYKKLKESVATYGKNLEPITVREVGGDKAKFEVIKGHHRYWAARMTDSYLYFRIDNEGTLDESIVETKCASNWTEEDLYKRGLKHNIPICKLIQDMFSRFPVLKDNTGTALRLVKDNLAELGYIKRCTLDRKLQTIDGINELKIMEVKDNDINNLRERIYRFIETIDVAERYLTESDKINGYNKLGFIISYSEAFKKNYNLISLNYDGYLKEWTRICRVKSNKNAKKTDKNLYIDMTSRDKKHIEMAITDIAKKVIK